MSDIPTGQTIEEQDYQRRIEEFVTELKALEEKHKINIMPIITSSPYGIIPQIRYLDKNKVDKLIEEQKAAGLAQAQPMQS